MSVFRGYGIFMKNKAPRDTHFIASRICGIRGAHSRLPIRVVQSIRIAILAPKWRNARGGKGKPHLPARS
jgi:hydrogenase large subunit